jgi:hypothetical protein
VDVSSQLNVLEDGHSLKELDILEGTGNSGAGHFMGAQAGNFPAVENDLSGVGCIEFGDAVDQAGLPRPVGADQGKKDPPGDIQIDLVKGLDPSEMQGKAVNLKMRFYSIHRNLPGNSLPGQLLRKLPLGFWKSSLKAFLINPIMVAPGNIWRESK